MIFKIETKIAAFLAAILLLPFRADARLVTVDFSLNSPKTALEKKLFIDSAILEAQSQMLALYYKGASFSPTWAKPPHRAILTNILRKSSYQETIITGLEALKRKQTGDQWHFVYRGNLPDDGPVVTDETLFAHYTKLLDKKSVHLTASFAMEVALANPSLNLKDKTMSFWRHRYQGDSFAMLMDKPVLSPDAFTLSARRIKADMVPDGISGVFDLLDRAPFNPALCQIALERLERAKLPALTGAISTSCLTLGKTEASYKGRLAKAKKHGAELPHADAIDKKAVIAEMAELQQQGWLNSDRWLTNLIINSLGDLPALFSTGALIEKDAAHHDNISSSADFTLEVLNTADDEGGYEDSDNLMLEGITMVDLPAEIDQFEQTPTIAAMRALASAFAEAGYPQISEIFMTQAE